MSRPSRATRPDGATVVVYAGWAVFHGWPYELIADPTPEEQEAARQDAITGRIEANRRAIAAWAT